MVRKARERAGLVSVPEHLFPIWDAYNILNHSRPSGFSGPQRLPLVEIVACRTLLAIPLGIRFVRLIQAMDDVFISSFAEQRRR